jgi:hypothetical protein
MEAEEEQVRGREKAAETAEVMRESRRKSSTHARRAFASGNPCGARAKRAWAGPGTETPMGPFIRSFLNREYIDRASDEWQATKG